MRIVLAYIIVRSNVAGDGEGYEHYAPYANRFYDSYKQHQPTRAHELVALLCGKGDRIPDNFSQHRSIEYYGGGWDIGAYQHASDALDCDLMVCIGATVYFHRAGWLDAIVQAFRGHGDGLYGATASLEQFPLTPAAGDCTPNPHLRTSFFACTPSQLSKFPVKINSRRECYQFESGDRNISKWFSERSLACKCVSWDGARDASDWGRIENGFRSGDQSNCLVFDRHTDLYAGAPQDVKAIMQNAAQGQQQPL